MITNIFKVTIGGRAHNHSHPCSKVVTVIFLTLSLSLSTQYVLAQESAFGDSNPIDKEQAIDLAKAYTGLDCKEKPCMRLVGTQIAEIATVSDSTTPFLSDQIDGRRVWRVIFDTVLFSITRVSEESQKLHPKRIEVVIDSTTGSLIEITCEDIKNEPYKISRVLSVASTNNLSQWDEKFLSFSIGTPAVTLAHALDSVFANPISAKWITAYLVNHQLSGQRRVVWSIQLNGVEPISLGGEMRTRIRCLVNAKSGRFIGATTSPSLPIKDDDR